MMKKSEKVMYNIYIYCFGSQIFLSVICMCCYYHNQNHVVQTDKLLSLVHKCFNIQFHSDDSPVFHQ